MEIRNVTLVKDMDDTWTVVVGSQEVGKTTDPAIVKAIAEEAGWTVREEKSKDESRILAK